MRLSPTGRRFLQSLEGLSLKAYPDPALPKVNGQWNPKQKWSIGYGHSGAYEGQVITRAEADRLFTGDVAKFEAIVSLTTPETTQMQFDAMVTLAYNIGTEGFSTSTVARLHNLGDYEGAAAAFAMWRKSGGAVNPVLVARRAKETSVYRGEGYPGIDGTVWSPSPISTQPVPVAPYPIPVAMQPVAIGACAALVAYWALPRIQFTRRALSIGGASG